MRGPARILTALAALGLLACGTAYAITAEIGNTFVSATATLQPRELPARGGAPVTLSSVTRIGARDGSQPPKLASIVFQLDKHGHLDASGLPVCTAARLAGTTPAQARRRCRGALVGKGTGRARVQLPGLPPRTVSSPLSFFNGPRIGGRPSLVVHAYETVPEPKALLVPIAIERIRHGRYGYEVKVQMPEIAGGYGAPTLAEATVGRTRKRGGREIGYLNAFCRGGRLQVHGSLRFANGDFFPATLASPCHLPR